MSNSIWDFVFSFAADASGIQQGFDDAQSAADDLEAELNIVDQAAQATQAALAGVADEMADVVMETAGLSPAVAAATSQAAALNRQLSVTDRISGRVVGQFRSWGHELVGMATGALALGALLGSVGEVSRFSLEMGTLAQRSGLAVETFGALTQEARNLGGEFTESEMFSALERLQTETDDVYGTLQRFQELTRDMSSNEAIKLGDSLGIDAVLVNVLQQAEGSLADITDRYVTLGGLTDEQLGQLRQTNAAWNQLQQSWQSAIRLVLITLSPALSGVSRGLASIVQWSAKNQDALTGFFIAAAAVITAVYMPAITAALSATLALAAPFLPVLLAIGAVGAAVALLYDDFMTFERGGQSVIGRMVQQWPQLGESIEGVRTLLRGFRENLFSLSDLGQRLIRDGMSGAFEVLADSVRNVFASIGNAYPSVAPLFEVLGMLLGLIYETIGTFSSLFLNLGIAVVKFIAQALFAVVQLFSDPQAALQTLKTAFGSLFDSFLEAIPTVTQAFREVRDVATRIIDTVLAKFKQVAGVISWLRGESAQGIDEAQLSVVGSPSDDNELVLPDGEVLHTLAGGSVATPEVLVTMGAIEQAANAASASIGDANQLAANTNNILNENYVTQSTMNNRTSSVDIGKIEIHTQATDAAGMRADIRSEIEQVFADIETDSRTGVQ